MSESINRKVQQGENKGLTDFDLRLQNAREISKGSSYNKNGKLPENGKAKAVRIGTELIVAVAVGGGIGFLIDTWLETKPWFLIGFILLGNIAGLWNIFRLTLGQSYKVGFEHDKQSKTLRKLKKKVITSD